MAVKALRLEKTVGWLFNGSTVLSAMQRFTVSDAAHLISVRRAITANPLWKREVQLAAMQQQMTEQEAV